MIHGTPRGAPWQKKKRNRKENENRKEKKERRIHGAPHGAPCYSPTGRKKKGWGEVGCHHPPPSLPCAVVTVVFVIPVNTVE